MIGSDTIYSAPLEIAPGSWHYAACTCDTETSTLALYFDGVLAGTLPQCKPGAVDVAGMTIGQNNNGSAGPPDDPFVGAIDGVRFTTVARTASAICKLSGRADCQ